ncbi:MAG TPA: hypothetical protein DIV86_02215, partial [Alphaproteobacteria bacterium]|nr:hypothetical protein [Alphaproteobacteria bacterium]
MVASKQVIAEEGLNFDLEDPNNCGVGGTIDATGEQTRETVEITNKMSLGYIHRTGTTPGRDDKPISDGNSIGEDLSVDYFNQVISEEFGKNDVILEEGRFAVGMFFLPQDRKALIEGKTPERFVEELIEENGAYELIGWRNPKIGFEALKLPEEVYNNIPVVKKFLNERIKFLQDEVNGLDIKDSDPVLYSKKLAEAEKSAVFETLKQYNLEECSLSIDVIIDLPNYRQPILRMKDDISTSAGQEAITELHCAISDLSRGFNEGKAPQERIYPASLSTMNVTYKGPFMPQQLIDFYDDRNQENYKTSEGTVHGKFATVGGTDVTKAHGINVGDSLTGDTNGDYVTIDNNEDDRNSFLATGVLKNPFDVSQAFDSAHMVAHVSDLKRIFGNLTEEAIFSLLTPAYEQDPDMPEYTKAFFRIKNMMFKPYSGPTNLNFKGIDKEGYKWGSVKDPAGSRPSWFYVTVDEQGKAKRLYKGSEVLHSVEELKARGEYLVYTDMLQSGEMFYFNRNEKKLYRNKDILEKITNPEKNGGVDYIKVLQSLLTEGIEVSDDEIDIYEFKKHNLDLTTKLNYFAWNRETRDYVINEIARTGLVPIKAMGDSEANSAFIRNIVAHFMENLKEKCVQIINPSLDVLRKQKILSWADEIGANPNLEEFKDRKLTPIKDKWFKPGELDNLKEIRSEYAAVIDCTAEVGYLNQFTEEEKIEKLNARVEEICNEVERAINEGKKDTIILSDENISMTRQAPTDAVVLRAVMTRLKEKELSPKASIICDSGQSKDPTHSAKLLTLGAKAVNERSMHEYLQSFAQENGLKYSSTINAYKEAWLGNLANMMGANGVSASRSYTNGLFVFLQNITNEDGMFGKIFKGLKSKVQGMDERDIASSMIRAQEDSQVQLACFKELNSEVLNILESAGLHEIKSKLQDEKTLYGLFSQCFNSFEEAVFLDDKKERVLAFKEAIRGMLETAGLYEHATLSDGAEKVAKSFETLDPLNKAISQNESSLIEAFERAKKGFNDIDLQLSGRYQRDVNSRRKLLGAETVEFYTEGVNRNIAAGKMEELEANMEEYEWRGKTYRRLKQSYIDDPNIPPSDGYRYYVQETEKMKQETPFHLANFRQEVEPDPSVAIPISEVQIKPSDVIKYWIKPGQISAGALVIEEGEFEKDLTEEFKKFQENPTLENITFRFTMASAWRAFAEAFGEILGNGSAGEGGVPIGIAGTPYGPAHIQNSTGQFGSHPEVVVATATRNEENDSIAKGVLQVKVIQGAKPKRGGKQTPLKVTVDIAALRQTYPHVPLPSPSEFADTMSVEDFMGLIRYYKSYDINLDVKIAVQPGCETVALAAAKSGVDNITLAGYGGTAASGALDARSNGDDVKDYIAFTRAVLDKKGFSHVSISAEGNYISHKDILFGMAHGRAAAGFGTMAMVSGGCVLAEVCFKGGVNPDSIWRAVIGLAKEGNQDFTIPKVVDYLSRVEGVEYCPVGMANSGILFDKEKSKYMMQQFIVDMAKATVEDMAKHGCRTPEEYYAKCNQIYQNIDVNSRLEELGQKLYGKFDMSIFDTVINSRVTSQEFIDKYIKIQYADDKLGFVDKVKDYFSKFRETLESKPWLKTASFLKVGPSGRSFAHLALGKGELEDIALEIGSRENPIPMEANYEAIGVRTFAQVAKEVFNAKKAAFMNAFPNRLALDAGQKILKIFTSGTPGQRAFAGMVPGVKVVHEGVLLDTSGRNKSGGDTTVLAPETFFTAFPDKIPEQIFVSNNPTAETLLVVAGASTNYGKNGGNDFYEGCIGPNFRSCSHGGADVGLGVKDYAGEFQSRGVMGVLTDNFGSGFGNGQIGGFNFVYDPNNKLQSNMDHSSLTHLPNEIRPLCEMVAKHYIELGLN